MSAAAGAAAVTPTLNRQLRLAARPSGVPGPECWQVVDGPVAAPGDGGVLVQVLALSIDPAMRGWMNEGKSYIAPVALGDVMRAGGAGVVVASRCDRFAVGDHVVGTPGVQQYWAVDAAQVARGALTPIDTGVATVEQWLNVLGMPGMTAYFGLLDVGRPRAGDTVVVSGAAGAVGQTVGQLARIKGCRVVADELGFDACIDYKAAAPADAPRWDAVRDGLKQRCPDGVDVYFDNVGGDILDAVLARLARKARVVICGAISQYNQMHDLKGPKNYMSLLVNRARMEGMVVFDYADRYPQAVAELAGYLKDGRLKSREDVMGGGIDAFPAALDKLFAGGNTGKLVLRLDR